MLEASTGAIMLLRLVGLSVMARQVIRLSCKSRVGRPSPFQNAVERARTDAAVRDAYEAGRPDGPRSFVNVAWAMP